MQMLSMEQDLKMENTCGYFFWQYVANKFLSTITNIFTNLNMSDIVTGYKLFKSKAIKS
jgi:hypothetical protein